MEEEELDDGVVHQEEQVEQEQQQHQQHQPEGQHHEEEQDEITTSSRQFYEAMLARLEAITQDQILEMASMDNVLEHECLNYAGTKITDLINDREQRRADVKALKAQIAKEARDANSVTAASIAIAKNAITSWMIKRKSLVLMTDSHIAVEGNPVAAPGSTGPVFAKLVLEAKRPTKKVGFLDILETIISTKQGSSLSHILPHYVELERAISADISEMSRSDPAAVNFLKAGAICTQGDIRNFSISVPHICARVFVGLMQHLLTTPSFKLVVTGGDQASSFDNVAVDHLLYASTTEELAATDVAQKAQHDLITAALSRVGDVKFSESQARGFMGGAITAKREDGAAAAANVRQTSAIAKLLANRQQLPGGRSGASTPGGGGAGQKGKFVEKPTNRVKPGSNDVKNVLEYYYPRKTTFHVNPSKFDAGHIIARRSLLWWHEICNLAAVGHPENEEEQADYAVASAVADSASCPIGLMSHQTACRLVAEAFRVKMNKKTFAETVEDDLFKSGVSLDGVMDFSTLLKFYVFYSSNVITTDAGVQQMADEPLVELERQLVGLGVLSPLHHPGNDGNIQQRSNVILQTSVVILTPLMETLDSMVENKSPVIFGSSAASSANATTPQMPAHQVCNVHRVGSATRSVPEILQLWSTSSPVAMAVAKQIGVFHTNTTASKEGAGAKKANANQEKMIGGGDVGALIDDLESEPLIDALEAAFEAVLARVSRTKRAIVMQEIDTLARTATDELMQNPAILENRDITRQDVDATFRISIAQRYKKEGKSCVDVKAEATRISSAGGGAVPSKVVLQGLKADESSSFVSQASDGSRVDYEAAVVGWYDVFSAAIVVFNEISAQHQHTSDDVLQIISTMMTSSDWVATFSRALLNTIPGFAATNRLFEIGAAGDNAAVDYEVAVARNQAAAESILFGSFTQDGVPMGVDDVASPSQAAAMATDPTRKKANKKKRSAETIIIPKTKVKKFSTHI